MKLTHDFEINGEAYTGRCTFEAINEFEEKTGLSIAEAWGQIADNRLKFSTVAAAVWAFVNGERAFQGQKKESYRVLGEKLHQAGFHNFVGVAGLFFQLTVPSGNDKSHEGEVEKKS